ncbi:MAG: GGDEF domain-containing protein [Acidobacteriota bacterium]|nr:GGDEF domain-containing protein [Acidobacteriota bacterium]
MDADVGAKRSRGRRRVAPAPLRVLLIAALVALMAGVIGGPDGLWLGLPGVLLAGSIGVTTAARFAGAAPVLSADIAAVALVRGSAMPPLWLSWSVAAGCLLVLSEVARRLRAERDQMELAAFSDPLTGVANRRLLMSVAEHEIARHRRAGERFAVVMLDLDGFKLLNDRFGHAAGDEMLCAVAAGITQALRSQDTIARLGGDEFCVIASATANARGLTDRIVGAVARAASGQEELQASCGMAVYPEDGATLELLLRVADERLLSAKRRLYGGAARVRAA